MQTQTLVCGLLLDQAAQIGPQGANVKKIRQFLLLKVAVPLAVFVFKLIAMTCRMKEINKGKMSPRQGKEKQYIYGFFHSQLLPTIYFYRNTKMGSLASMLDLIRLPKKEVLPEQDSNLSHFPNHQDHSPMKRKADACRSMC